ncbi:hypothetical protein QVD17_02143 [Tagetes erecta]|uniref:NAB domain-containing protein n=1 Tax=Tagetes erecta TaxID=13708 RepID=A0AAD8L620_TARER|nr:hypothetical protein QVD17_02143 [Tagetes erecta]
MLSRAARNAYSWWWASHIRTKQSKWLDQNLLDMEEKVDYILKIITEDGDSFRVRAEQYYSKRPELVNFVEDTFRGYRALAERYDHLSRDLQSANRTIAMVFPERVHMTFDEEEYEGLTSDCDENKNMVLINSNVPMPPLSLPLPPKQNHLPKMEGVVQAMIKKKSKMPTKMMLKRGLMKIGVDENASRVSKSSGLSKDEALDEIEKLQKDVLGFQTEKEFVKSSYENVLSKYWEIENKINELHTRISNLQHEFAVGEAMNDHDAQTLMSSFALKMCKETVGKLKRKRTRTKAEELVEHHRVDDIRKKFEALIAHDDNDTKLKNLEQTTEHVKDKKTAIEEKTPKSIEENGALIQQHLHNPNMETSEAKDQKAENIETVKELTISEVAEKIELLVDKVISLETDLASQTALVTKLRFEIDELQEQLQSLEQENNNLVGESKNKNIKIKKLEEELERVQMLDEQVKLQDLQLETSFDEASLSLDTLSKDLLNAKPDEDTDEDDVIPRTEKSETEKLPRLEEVEKESQSKDSDDLVKKSNEKIEGDRDGGEHLALTESPIIRRNQQVDCNGKEDEPKWSLILSHEIEDRERMLLEEYASTLKNFKEVKQKLKETENRNRARSFKSAVQMKMLRSSNDSKDAEIRSLYDKLKRLETNIANRVDFELKIGPDLGGEGIEHEKITENEAQDLFPEEYELDETTDIEITKASNAIDEGTHRIKKLVENAHDELKKARELIDGGNQKTKEADETIESCEPVKSADSVEEGTQRSKELDETTEFELNKAPNAIEETQRTKDHGNSVDNGHDSQEIEDEIRTEIEDLRKENLELWLRFSTAYHQINRFQDSFHDLVQEIKQVNENKQEHGKQRHHHHHSPSSLDIRPLYRHLRDIQTEVILWLEKSGILEDDLQHRLSSLSDIENELSALTKDVSENVAAARSLNNNQAAKFQGEVINMKQENVKVINELREAYERVRMLQIEIEKTLSKLDEEIGQLNKSNASSRAPFRSILFRSKLRKKRKHSLFTCMNPSLQRQYSNLQELPQPREDS